MTCFGLSNTGPVLLARSVSAGFYADLATTMVFLVVELILGLKAGLKLFPLVIPTTGSFKLDRSVAGPLLFVRSDLGLAWDCPPRLMLATLMVEGTLRLLLFSFCLTLRKGVLKLDS